MKIFVSTSITCFASDKMKFLDSAFFQYCLTRDGVTLKMTNIGTGAFKKSDFLFVISRKCYAVFSRHKINYHEKYAATAILNILRASRETITSAMCTCDRLTVTLNKFKPQSRGKDVFVWIGKIKTDDVSRSDHVTGLTDRQVRILTYRS